MIDQTAITLCQRELAAADRSQHPPSGRDRRGGSRRARRHPRSMSTIPTDPEGLPAPRWTRTSSTSKREFSSIRSGKASPNMLDTVRVEMYGQQMPLNQVASVTAPEPRVLIVTPFDKGQVKVDREGDSRVRPRARAVGAGRRHPRAAAADERAAPQGAREGRPQATPRKGGSPFATRARTRATRSRS